MRDDALLREFNNFVKPKSLRREVHDECPRTFGATRFKRKTRSSGWPAACRSGLDRMAPVSEIAWQYGMRRHE